MKWFVLFWETFFTLQPLTVIDNASGHVTSSTSRCELVQTDGPGLNDVMKRKPERGREEHSEQSDEEISGSARRENTVIAFPPFQVILSKQNQMFKQNQHSHDFTNEMQSTAAGCMFVFIRVCVCVCVEWMRTFIELRKHIRSLLMTALVWVIKGELSGGFVCFWAHYCKVLLLYNHPLTQEREHCGPTLF